jgi:ElaA protein
MTMDVNWHWYAWKDLGPDTLYALLKLRSDIFVVEQNCLFSDMDGLDPQCEHLCGFDDAGQLVAYLRLIQPGVKWPQPGLGRLVVRPNVRHSGIARVALCEGIDHCSERYPGQTICLSGQQYLEHFYVQFGFVTVSDMYLEAGIPHVEMRRKPPVPKK